jgi:hypothetical protein
MSSPTQVTVFSKCFQRGPKTPRDFQESRGQGELEHPRLGCGCSRVAPLVCFTFWGLQKDFAREKNVLLLRKTKIEQVKLPRHIL